MLCKNAGESLNHLFLKCTFSRAVWSYFLGNLNIAWVMPREVVDLFGSWVINGLGERRRGLWRCLCHAVIWNLWKERNSRIFEETLKPSSEVIDSTIRDVGNWLFASNMFQGLSLMDWLTCTSLNSLKKKIIINCWSSPPLGSLKLNFDGSSMGNPGLSGFGCVIWDSKGEVVRIVAGPIGFADSTKAEVMNLLMGLKEICDLNMNVPLVEGDSSVVVGWGLGSSKGSWKYAQQIHEIRDLAALQVKLKHVPRFQKGLADKLAKWGLEQPSIVKTNVNPS